MHSSVLQLLYETEWYLKGPHPSQVTIQSILSMSPTSYGFTNGQYIQNTTTTTTTRTVY